VIYLYDGEWRNGTNRRDGVTHTSFRGHALAAAAFA